MRLSSEKTKTAALWTGGVCAFAAACVLIACQCHVGFSSADEAFYLTIPLRLLRGDALFADEWHLSQMASFLLLPFVYLYQKLAPSTEGIVLAFRYIFTFVWIAGSLAVFGRLRRISLPAAFAAACALVLFVPFGIMALSYNSLGVLCMTLSAVVLCTADKRSGAARYVSGVFFAAAVLCCPYLAAVFFLYSIALAVYAVRRREKRRTLFGAWLSFTLGVLTPAVLFAAFVCSRASVREIANALPLMLSDPEHTARTVLQNVRGYFGCILHRSAVFTVPLVSDVLLLVWLRLFRKKQNVVRLLFGGILLSTAVWLVVIFAFERNPNFLTLPLQIFPPLAVCLVNDTQTRRWFRFGYVPVLLYSVCIYLSSNTGLFAISLACAASIPACMLALTACVRSLCASTCRVTHRRILCAGACLLAALQIGLFAAVRCTFVYGDFPRSALTASITSGPCRGLRCAAPEKDVYDTLEAETRAVRQSARIDTVLYLSNNTYLYLFPQHAAMGAYSAWLSGVRTSTLPRLQAYYTLHPDRIPQAVYFDFNDTIHARPDEQPQAAYDAFAVWLETQLSLTAQETASGNVWFLP